MQCPYHADHENRIKRLEANMDKVLEGVREQKTLVAVFSLLATIVSTIGSVVGALIGAYAKARGWI